MSSWVPNAAQVYRGERLCGRAAFNSRAVEINLWSLRMHPFTSGNRAFRRPTKSRRWRRCACQIGHHHVILGEHKKSEMDFGEDQISCRQSNSLFHTGAQQDGPV